MLLCLDAYINSILQLVKQFLNYPQTFPWQSQSNPVYPQRFKCCLIISKQMETFMTFCATDALMQFNYRGLFLVKFDTLLLCHLIFINVTVMLLSKNLAISNNILKLDFGFSQSKVKSQKVFIKIHRFFLALNAFHHIFLVFKKISPVPPYGTIFLNDLSFSQKYFEFLIN